MYYLTLIIGLILSFINDRKKISFYLFLAIIAFLTFFRYGVGPDYFSYRFLFSRLNESFILEALDGIDSQEIGFRILGSMLKGIGANYQIYLVVIGAINLYFVTKISSQYSKNPTLSLVVYYSFYFFVWTFSGLRQGITIVIGVYFLLKYIQEKKDKKFILVIFALAFIHSSVVILIPLYYLGQKNFSQKRIILFSLFSVFLSLIPLGKAFEYLKWIPIVNKASYYWNPNAGINNIMDFQSLGRIIFLAIALFFYKAYVHRDDISRKIMNLYILGIDFYFIFKFSEGIAGRLSIYGKILDIIILVNIYYLFKDKFNKLIYTMLLIIVCNLYLFKELDAMKVNVGLEYNNNIFLVPYSSIWNNEQYYFNNRSNIDIN